MDNKAHIILHIKLYETKDLTDFISLAAKKQGDSGLVIHVLTTDAGEDQEKALREWLSGHKKAAGVCQITDESDLQALRYAMMPVYVFEPTLEFWERIFAAYVLPDVQYTMFAQDFLWKLTYGVLWPYNYDEDQMAEAHRRVSEILNLVNDLRIQDIKSYGRPKKIYMFSLMTNGSIGFRQENDGRLRVLRYGAPVYTSHGSELMITRFRPHDGLISIRGFLKNPVYTFAGEPVLYIQKGEDRQGAVKVPLCESSWSYSSAVEKTNDFYSFTLELSEDEYRDFSFFIELAGKRSETYLNFIYETVFFLTCGRNRYYLDGKRYMFRDNHFYVDPEDKKEKEQFYREQQETADRDDPEMGVLRRKTVQQVESVREAGRRIWLYYDSVDDAGDNGYIQFMHDVKIDDGAERYYVLNGDLKDCESMFPGKLRDRVVIFGSEKHMMLLVSCEKILTSYIEFENLLPVDLKRYDYVINAATIPEVTYLQHGVCIAWEPWKYALDRLPVDHVVISTREELNEALGENGYTEDKLIKAGMPRLDLLDREKVPEKKILYAPAFRIALVDHDELGFGPIKHGNTGYRPAVTRFSESAFYRGSLEFLKSPELAKALKQYGYRLEFRIHPFMKCYRDLYELDGDVITCAPDDADISDYQIVVTDFSSIMMDFEYMGRSVLHYCPDYKEFRSGMYDYRRLTFDPVTEGPGPWTEDAESAVRGLEKLMARDGVLSRKYRKRGRRQFFERTEDCRDMIYKAVSGEERSV